MRKLSILSLPTIFALTLTGISLTSCGPSKDSTNLVNSFKDVDSGCEKVTDTCIKKLTKESNNVKSLKKLANDETEPNFLLSEVNYFTGLMYTFYVFYNIDYAVEKGYPKYNGSYTDLVYDEVQTLINPNNDDQIKKNNIYFPFYCTFEDKEYGYSCYVDWDCIIKGSNNGYFVSVFGDLVLNQDTGKVSSFTLTTTTQERGGAITALDYSIINLEKNELLYTRIQNTSNSDTTTTIVDYYNDGELALQKCFDLNFNKIVIAKGNITTNVDDLVMGGYEITADNVEALKNSSLELKEVSDSFDEVYNNTKNSVLRDMRSRIVTGKSAKRVHFYEDAVSYGRDKANVYLEYNENNELVNIYRTGYLSKDNLLKAIDEESKNNEDETKRNILNKLYKLYKEKFSASQRTISNSEIEAIWLGLPSYKWHTTYTVQNTFDFLIQDLNFDHGTRSLSFTLDGKELTDVKLNTIANHSLDYENTSTEVVFDGELLVDKIIKEIDPYDNIHDLSYQIGQPASYTHRVRCSVCGEVVDQDRTCYEYDEDRFLISKSRYTYSNGNVPIVNTHYEYSKEIISGLKVCTQRKEETSLDKATKLYTFEYSNVSINKDEYSFHLVEKFQKINEDLETGVSFIAADIDVVIKSPRFIDLNNFDEDSWNSEDYATYKSISGVLRTFNQNNENQIIEYQLTSTFDENKEYPLQNVTTYTDAFGNTYNLDQESEIDIKFNVFDLSGNKLTTVKKWCYSNYNFEVLKDSFFPRYNILRHTFIIQ